MAQLNNDAAEQRLTSYLDRIGNMLGHAKRRACFAAYATGLMGNSERKSVEPIAAAQCPDPQKIDAAH